MSRSAALALLVATAVALPSVSSAQSVLPDDFELDKPAPKPKPEPKPERDAEPEAKPKPRKSKSTADEPRSEEPVQTRKKVQTRPKIKNRRLSSGLGFTLTLGGLATLRRMEFAGTDHRIAHQPGLYLGGVIGAVQQLWMLKKSKSHVLLEAEGGFGSAKNGSVEPALGRALTTEHAYLLVLGVFEKPIHPTVDLRLGLGLSALSYTVESNPEYTGHRYLSLAASFGAAYWMSTKTKIGANIVFLPGLSTNQSAGGYGSARSFGGRFEPYISWRFLQPEPPDRFGSAEFGVRYSYARFQTSMPETQALGDLARTSDAAHTLTLGVSYNL